MSRHRLCLACGGLDIICVSCYGVVKGNKVPHCIKNANGDFAKKQNWGIDRTNEMAYY